jgi:hypothetical protein
MSASSGGERRDSRFQRRRELRIAAVHAGGATGRI